MNEEPTHKFEVGIGHLLRAGVLLSAGIVLVGAAMYLKTSFAAQPHYHIFSGEPRDLTSVRLVSQEAVHASSALAVIQFGLLALIATPVVRVVFSVFVFLKQKDWMYTVFTLIVVALLGYSLLGH